MADISDVRDKLVSIIADIIYPDGLAGPRFPDVPVLIYGGWPERNQLQHDLADPGKPRRYHVSVWPMPMERPTTRSHEGYEEQDLPTATYAAAVVGQAVVITGAAPDPYRAQNLAVIIDRRSYVHTAEAGQTPAQIAALLASDIAADWPGTTATLGNITVPAPARIMAARVGVIGTAIRVVAQQEKGFQVSIWTDSDEERVRLAKQIAPVLGATTRMQLADGSMATLTCRSNNDMDKAMVQGAYVRHMVYSVEFATTEALEAAQMVVAQTELKSPAGDVISFSEA